MKTRKNIILINIQNDQEIQASHLCSKSRAFLTTPGQLASHQKTPDFS